MKTDSGTPRSKLITAAIVIRNLEEIPGYNGAILKIDDDEAERISNDIESAADYYEREAAALRADRDEHKQWRERLADKLHDAESDIRNLRADRNALAVALRNIVREVEFLIEDGTLNFAAGSHPSMINAHQALAAHGGKK